MRKLDFEALDVDAAKLRHEEISTKSFGSAKSQNM